MKQLYPAFAVHCSCNPRNSLCILCLPQLCELHHTHICSSWAQATASAGGGGKRARSESTGDDPASKRRAGGMASPTDGPEGTGDAESQEPAGGGGQTSRQVRQLAGMSALSGHDLAMQYPWHLACPECPVCFTGHHDLPLACSRRALLRSSSPPGPQQTA